MSSPKISVIVPVYDVEKYIERCIRSVLRQTFEDYELIIVNDCTPCNSINIVRNILEEGKWPNVRVIERTVNGGLGAARNSGIRESLGEYLFFLDSDDWLDDFALEKVCLHAEKTRADIIAANFFIAVDNYAYPASTFKNFDSQLPGKEFVLNFNPGAWNKLYKRSLFLNEGIFFPEDRQWYEDVATVPLLVAKAGIVSILNEPLIYYYQRPDSIMGKTKNGNHKLFDIFKSVDRLISHRRFFSRNEWIGLEENLVFHTAAARLDDILGIRSLFVRYKFVRELYRRMGNTLPMWKTAQSFNNHCKNYTGDKRFYYRKAYAAFSTGKWLKTIFWSIFIKKTNDQRQKILFAIPTLHIGGAEKVFTNMLKFLDHKKFNITVYVYESSGEMEKFIPKDKIRLVLKNAKAIALYSGSFAEAILSRTFTIKDKILKVRMTLLNKVYSRELSYAKYVEPHTVLPYSAFDIAAAFTELTPEMTRFILQQTDATKKYIWIHNDFNPAFLNYIDDKLFENNFNCFHRIVAVSSGAALSLAGRFVSLKGKISVINNFLETNDLAARANEEISDLFDPGYINFVSVGRVDMHTKGYDRIISIARKLKDEGYVFRWYIVGDGPEFCKMKEMIKEHNVDDVIYLTGSKINPYPYIRHADALVLPSRFEAYPTVVLEAHTIGTPCIVAKNSGSPDQFRHITNLVLENDDKSICEGLRRFLADPALRERMKQEVKIYKYDNEEILQKIEKLFEIRSFDRLNKYTCSADTIAENKRILKTH
jgi:glycosyltransferase involved in cell wall biosynthesis